MGEYNFIYVKYDIGRVVHQLQNQKILMRFNWFNGKIITLNYYETI